MPPQRPALPTSELRRPVFEARGGPAWNFLARTSDPARALQHLLERDRLFTDRLAADTERLDLRTVQVDGSLTESALAQQMARSFGYR